MSKRKVLLVGWDAADWKIMRPLLDQGLMPTVQSLVDQGTMGPITTLQPPLSPMLWTSIATGKRPYKHGIHGFSEPTADGRGVQPVSNLSRKCKAVWNIFNQNGLRSIVIGWWPSHPAEPLNGVTVSDHFHRAKGKDFADWPPLKGAVHPESLAKSLAEIRLHPAEITGDFLDFLIPLAREIDQSKDRRLHSAAKILCELTTIHSAATWLLDHESWDFFGVYYDAIDHFCHGFMKYHPPRREWIQERDFELYQHVVTMAYRLHDQMLGVLLRKVDPQTTVILMSDHGFHPDNLRPRVIPNIPAGPAVEHRDLGVFAIRGPGIRRDALVHGATVLDVTPTLLALYGLPVGADMDGKVLTDVFESPPEVRLIPSWEEVAGDDGRHPPHTWLDPEAARESLEQLVALGYIEAPEADQAKAVARTIRELRFNLAQALQDGSRHGEALEILRELHLKEPDEQRFAVHRFLSAQALGLIREMQEVMRDLDGRRRELYSAALPRLKEFSQLIKQRKDKRLTRQPDRTGPVPSVSPLEPADPSEAPPDSDEALLQDAEAELARTQMAEAQLDEALIAKAGQADAKPPRDTGVKGEDTPEAQPPHSDPLLTVEEREEFLRLRDLARFSPHLVDFLKAQTLARRGRHAEALEVLATIPESNVQQSGLYVQTGKLYARLKRWDEAEAALNRALAIDPDNPQAHLSLARVALHRHQPRTAAEHSLRAIECRSLDPMAHFLLGLSLTALHDYPRSARAYRAALMLNPNFARAHLRLGRLLQHRLSEPAEARFHFRLYRQITGATATVRRADLAQSRTVVGRHEPAGQTTTSPFGTRDPDPAHLPPTSETVNIVSGLPRSGTSMVMQMLAAAGLPILTDGLRGADDDNPRGYLEYERVKGLHTNSGWLAEARGQVVKIVAPLMRYLPAGVPCRVVMIERHLDEILASQGKMLVRRGAELEDTPERRERLKREYGRMMMHLRNLLQARPETHVLFLRHGTVLSDPRGTAERLNRFLGGTFDTARMAAEVQPELHRNRST